jgi:hypothetical protein
MHAQCILYSIRYLSQITVPGLYRVALRSSLILPSVLPAKLRYNCLRAVNPLNARYCTEQSCALAAPLSNIRQVKRSHLIQSDDLSQVQEGGRVRAFESRGVRGLTVRAAAAEDAGTYTLRVYDDRGNTNLVSTCRVKVTGTRCMRHGRGCFLIGSGNYVLFA